MKNLLLMLAVSGSLIQGAESSIITLEQIPACVSNAMIHSGIIDVKGQAPEALNSPVGQAYEMTDQARGGVCQLTVQPLVVVQTNLYSNVIQNNQTLKQLAGFAETLVICNAPEAERVIALVGLGSKYGRILKKLVQHDVPGLKFRPTLKATIEKNTEVTLDEKQLTCLNAAQLAMTLNLQQQFNIDPVTFKVMFNRWLPAEPKAQASSSWWPSIFSRSSSAKELL